MDDVAGLIDALPHLQRLALRDNPTTTPFLDTHSRLLVASVRVRELDDCFTVLDIPITAQDRLAALVAAGAPQVLPWGGGEGD